MFCFLSRAWLPPGWLSAIIALVTCCSKGRMSLGSRPVYTGTQTLRTKGETTAMAYPGRLHSIWTVAALLAVTTTSAFAQAVEPVRSLAAKEKPALLDTLKTLVSIESGRRDIEGLGKVADLVAARLSELGGQVELVEPSNVYKMEDTPDQLGKMVRATFTGTGSKKILLIAHMDTVYQRGMLEKQPFRIDGDRAYGLGIADDKHGIALILHTIAMLKALDFRQYATLTVLINADEEISSPGSRSLITRLG